MVDIGTEHRLGLGLGWRLEGARLDGANDNPGSRLGVRMSARW